MHPTPITFSLFAIFFIGLGAWLVDWFFQRKEFFNQLKIKRLKSFVLSGFFQFITLITFNAALLYGVTSNISAMRRTVMLFETILAYFILHQRGDIYKRVLASVGIVIGVILIAIFK